MTTPYPDLIPLIEELAARRSSASDAHLRLLDKWVGSLEKIHLEMRQLEKLEGFAAAVQPKNGDRA